MVPVLCLWLFAQEAFCARMVREHGGDMLDAKSMGEDLKSFCEQDDFCRPGRAAVQDIQSPLCSIASATRPPQPTG